MQFPLQFHTITVRQQAVSFFLPDEERVREAYKKGEISFPYWSRVWPAAIALAEFLVQHPDYTVNKNVVELGAGLGLPSLAAAQNAKTVLCTDCSAEAVAVAQQSAQYNGFKNFRSAVMDWRNLPDNFWADTLLLSDVNYETAAFPVLLNVLKRFFEKGTTVVLSTPHRLMAKDFITLLLPFCKRQEECFVNGRGESTAVSVMVLQQ